MKFLLKQVYITDPQSPYHRSRKDIFIADGIIRNIADNIHEAADRELAPAHLSVSPGWVDVFAHFCDPGYEFRETLQTGAAAAAAGGYTTVLVIPNTQPVIDAKTQVKYIVQQSRLLPVQVIPIGAISRGAEGKELAEMYDMHNSGAMAFSDGLQPLQAAGILLKALQYIKAFNGVIIQLPDDKTIAPHGLMNEGLVSTRLGLPGKPAMAEEIMVARDIKLLRYTGSRLHITGVSTAKSIEYIQRAKEGGLDISCSVTPYHLAFCDEDLQDYDTNLKVNPPLRSRQDMMALRQALADGIIDCIATHHLPQNLDHKDCEFEYAKNGMIGLQTSYSVLKSVLPQIPEERWVELLSIQPRSIFGLEQASIQEGRKACLTLFQPEQAYQFTRQQVQSRSFNTPFAGRQFTGSVAGIINGHHMVLNKP